MGIFDASKITTTTTRPLDIQEPFLKKAFGEAQNLFDLGGPQVFQGPRLAPFDPLEVKAQEGFLQGAQNLIPTADASREAALFNLTTGRDPSQNPFLQSALDAAIFPVTRNFQENLLPALEDRSIGAGGLGGAGDTRSTRLAVRDSDEAIQRLVSQIVLDQFDKGQSRALQTQQLLPSIIQSSLAPSAITEGVGSARREMGQAELDVARQKFGEEQDQPYESLSRFFDIVGKDFGSEITSTVEDEAATFKGLLGLGGIVSSFIPDSVKKDLIDKGLATASDFFGFGGEEAGGAGGTNFLSGGDAAVDAAESGNFGVGEIISGAGAAKTAAELAGVNVGGLFGGGAAAPIGSAVPGGAFVGGPTGAGLQALGGPGGGPGVASALGAGGAAGVGAGAAGAATAAAAGNLAAGFGGGAALGGPTGLGLLAAGGPGGGIGVGGAAAGAGVGAGSAGAGAGAAGAAGAGAGASFGAFAGPAVAVAVIAMIADSFARGQATSSARKKLVPQLYGNVQWNTPVAFSNPDKNSGPVGYPWQAPNGQTYYLNDAVKANITSGDIDNRYSLFDETGQFVGQWSNNANLYLDLEALKQETRIRLENKADSEAGRSPAEDAQLLALMSPEERAALEQQAALSQFQMENAP